MKNTVESILRATIEGLITQGTLPPVDPAALALTIPANKEFGDFTTNFAMQVSKAARRKPREVAEVIREALQAQSHTFARIEVAGPGFINLSLHPQLWTTVLQDIGAKADTYGESAYGAGKKVQVEFVSANPTGPLHIGHGRGAAVGDTLARILKATGHDVQREYYINDVGNQMNTLGKSVLARYRELCGVEGDFPEEGYKGDYIRDLAGTLKEIHGEALLEMDENEAIGLSREYAAGSIMETIRADLERFNVHFEHWFSEASLYREGKVERALDELRERGFIYDHEGALWFASSRLGDEKDRVIKKQDGSLTYFAPDIAYHSDKLGRGFEQVIDIWGADHHGYVPRMRAAIEALGAPREAFHALLIQLVSLERDGKPVYMSTRAGEFVTLKEILDEVGKDAARYFFMMRKCDSHLIFDLELAKKKSEENPVFYIQYAHARVCSILRNAQEQGLGLDAQGARLDCLSSDEDLALIKLLASYPDMLIASAQSLEPHRVSFYLLDLATSFHRFYNKNRVISNDEALTRARLVLVDAVRQVIHNALALMGIDAPESM